MIASAEGHETTLRILLDFDAETNFQDNEGRTALHWAAGNGHTGCVEELLQNGAVADLEDNYGNLPLHVASAGDSVDSVTVLSDSCDIDAVNKAENTALHVACLLVSSHLPN